MKKLITTKETKMYLEIQVTRLVLDSLDLAYLNYNIFNKHITYIEKTDFCTGKTTLERKLNAVTIEKVQVFGSGNSPAECVDDLIKKDKYFAKYYGDKKEEIAESLSNGKQSLFNPYDMSENENTLIIEDTLDFYHESITGVINPMCYTGDIEITEKTEEIEIGSPSIELSKLVTK